MNLKPTKKANTQLWQFLLQLLNQKTSIIEWSNLSTLEFKLNEPEEVARQWGRKKNRSTMNYEKLSRSLRYYYEKGIMQKIQGERYVYKFTNYNDVCIYNSNLEATQLAQSRSKQLRLPLNKKSRSLKTVSTSAQPRFSPYATNKSYTSNGQSSNTSPGNVSTTSSGYGSFTYPNYSYTQFNESYTQSPKFTAYSQYSPVSTNTYSYVSTGYSTPYNYNVSSAKYSAHQEQTSPVQASYDQSTCYNTNVKGGTKENYIYAYDAPYPNFQSSVSPLTSNNSYMNQSNNSYGYQQNYSTYNDMYSNYKLESDLSSYY